MLDCRYASKCSGCPWIQFPFSEQKEKKIQTFQKLWLQYKDDVELPALTYHSFGPGGYRSRLDFIWEEGRLGLYEKYDPSLKLKKIIDLEECLQLEPELQSFLQDFRKIKWPVRKGSIRLRVSPTGKRGAWLDFSNEDIKNLLQQEKELLMLQELAFVEIGQKHKRLIRKKEGALGLGEPEFHSWFQTWMGEKPIPLYSTVASFTQPSHLTNKKITQTLSAWIQQIQPHHVLEFGSGIGNLTFPALNYPESFVTATDVEERALQGLEKSLQESGFQSRVNIQRGDFRRQTPRYDQPLDLLLLNPARNGVGTFLKSLLPSQPQNLIYMSCYPESFFLDIQNLHGYSLTQIELFDQFPQTSHVEILAKFERN